MTRQFPRRAVAWLPFALALGAVIAVALWPRPGLSSHDVDEAIRAALTALEREDVATAEGELRRLDDAGVHADQVELIRAVVAVGHDDLAAAATIGRAAPEGHPRPRRPRRRQVGPGQRRLSILPRAGRPGRCRSRLPVHPRGLPRRGSRRPARRSGRSGPACSRSPPRTSGDPLGARPRSPRGGRG